MTAKNTSDTRRFRFSLALSLVLNAGLLLLAGWRALPDRPVLPQARPHIRLVTLARIPAPPASARRGLAAARALTHRQTPQARSRPTKAHPTALPHPRVKPVPPQPESRLVEVQESEVPPALQAFKIVTAHTRSALVVPRLHVPTPPPRAVQANPLPLTPSPAAPTHQPTPAHQPAPAAATPEPAAATPGGEEADRGEPAGEGVGLTGGAGVEANQKAGGPFGIGDGLKSSGKVRHIVYVLDISGSMSSRIGRADDELRGAMHGLRPGETFNIVAFSGGSVLFDPDMAEATPWMVQRASIFLDTLKIGGGTNLGAAVARALMLRDVNEVVVMTDGVPTAGELDFRRLAQVIRQFNTRHARISTVGMVGRNPDNTDNSFEAAGLLREIADDSGGASKLVTVGSSNP